MRLDNYKFDSSFSLLFLYKQGLIKCASTNFSQVSKLQYEYRKKLFDLYSKYKDDKTDEYFKQYRALEREQKKAVQQAAKEIYDSVKTALGHEQKVKGKTVVNKYNYWLYKGSTGMKITVTVDDVKVMSLKCSRDIDHEESGALEKVLVILGNEDKLNKKKNKDKYLKLTAKDASDIIKIYSENLKKVL